MSGNKSNASFFNQLEALPHRAKFLPTQGDSSEDGPRASSIEVLMLEEDAARRQNSFLDLENRSAIRQSLLRTRRGFFAPELSPINSQQEQSSKRKEDRFEPRDKNPFEEDVPS